MTITIPPTVRSYPNHEPVEVLPCTECLDLLEPDELTDCGTHRLCADCLASSTCSGCTEIRHEIAADMAEQAAYDAWRDTQEDYR